MNKLFSVIALLFITLVTFSQNQMSHLMVKSGYVEYELTGNTKGTKQEWWTDYGKKRYIETKSVTETDMFGTKTKEEKHTITIIIEHEIWEIDMLQKKGIKGANPMYSATLEATRNMTEAEARKFADDIIKAMNGQRLPNEKFLGYDCEVVTIMGVKVWTYKGVNLKTETNVMGIVVNETAKKFDKDITIPDSKFKVPANITFEEMPALPEEND